MKLTIHGPNLNDQSKGTFHVHTAECRDNRKEVTHNGSESPITGDYKSVIDVVELIYGDHMAEHPTGDKWSTPDVYVSDFHFAPCTNDLPYVTDEETVTEAKVTEDDLTDCDGCNGSGIYYGRGYVENGVFKGYTNTCFRCQGKGKQNAADRKRNRNYDRYHRKIYA